jgi:hypothetical protein
MSVCSEAAAVGPSYLRRWPWTRPMSARLDILRPTLGSLGWAHAGGTSWLSCPACLPARGMVARLGPDTGCRFVSPMPAVVHGWMYALEKRNGRTNSRLEERERDEWRRGCIRLRHSGGNQRAIRGSTGWRSTCRRGPLKTATAKIHFPESAKCSPVPHVPHRISASRGLGLVGTMCKRQETCGRESSRARLSPEEVETLTWGSRHPCSIGPLRS